MRTDDYLVDGNNSYLCYCGNDGSCNAQSRDFGFRPVFTLKSNSIKIDSTTEKDGTSERKAYDLKIE